MFEIKRPKTEDGSPMFDVEPTFKSEFLPPKHKFTKFH